MHVRAAWAPLLAGVAATAGFGAAVPLFLKPGVEAFNAGENAGRSKAVETTIAVNPSTGQKVSE